MATGKWLLAFLLLAAPASAQITPVYTFTAGTIISPDEMNTNFALLQSALNRAGGTMTGTLNARLILPVVDATFDLGSNTQRFRNQWLSGNLTVTGGITAATLTGNLVGGASSVNCVGCIGPTELASTGTAVGGYGTPTAIPGFNVDADGRITGVTSYTPQLTLTSTYFSSLNAAALTNIPAAAITGTMPPATMPANAAILNAPSNTFTGQMVYASSGVMGYAARSLGVVYATGTDGFLLVRASQAIQDGGTGTSTYEVRCDAGNPPTTLRGKQQVLNTTEPYVTFTVPIPRNTYYQVVATQNDPGGIIDIQFVALGTGG